LKINSFVDVIRNRNIRLARAAIWRFAAELCREFSHDLYLFEEMHPHEDSLTVHNNSGQLLCELNLEGYFWQRIEGCDPSLNIDLWEEMILQNNIESSLGNISSLLNLGTIGWGEPTNRTRTYSFIADWFASKAFAVDKYECFNGYHYKKQLCDFFQEGNWLEDYPQISERLMVSLKNDHLGEPSTRFWFLTKNDIPIACLETEGYFWDTTGKKTMLNQVDIRNIE